MKPAKPHERGEIEQFLRDDVENALLPLSQLARFGMAGGHLRALDVWIDRSDGRICDVLALNGVGLVLPQCPNARWAACAAAIAGREVSLVHGPRQQVRGLIGACGLDHQAGRVDRDEPYLTLSLDRLSVPPGAGRLVPVAEAPRGVIIGWLAAYLGETLGLTGGMAQIAALDDYESYCAAGSHAVLMEAGTPLGMTGFNGHQPGVVQVGGVYTPPELRGLGLARRAVALHLAQARDQGVARAVLSASSAAAVRAYEAIGFRRAGWWSLCLFDPPVRIGAEAFASCGSSPHVGPV